MTRDVKQLTIEYPAGAKLSIKWKSRELAEASADVYRRRGVRVEVAPEGRGFAVVGAA